MASVVNPGDLAGIMASGVVDAQTRLDEEFAAAVAAFHPVREEAEQAGFHALVDLVAPARVVVREAEVALEANLVQQLETTRTLQVELINLGFTARYSSRTYSQSTLRFTVAQT